MILVLILGLAMTVVALTFAGRRAWFLYRLIKSGQPAPDRIEGVTGRVGTALKTQLVEVFGAAQAAASGRCRAPPTSSSSGRS